MRAACLGEANKLYSYYQVRHTLVLKYGRGVKPVFKANTRCNTSKLITLKLKCSINHFVQYWHK